MARHGMISEFDSTSEDWASYMERLQQYFVANGVGAAGKQRAILLSICGATTYRLIRSLVAPDKPSDRSFVELVELVRAHHNPKPSATVQRFKFNSRHRRQGESVVAFVAELRQLTEYCDFGASLDDILCDRLVCGINDERIQQRLLAETNLTFQRAFELAQALEAAARHARDLQQKSPVESIHAIRSRKEAESSDSEEGECYRCKGRHAANNCRFKRADCHKCGKRGHIARACRNSKRNGQANFLSEESQDPVYDMFQISSSTAKTEPPTTTLMVQDTKLHMQIDTGVAVTVISEKTYWYLRRKRRAPTLRHCHARLRTVTGELVNVRGVITLDIRYKDRREYLRLFVIKGRGPALLGRDGQAKLDLYQDCYRLK